MEFLQSLPPLTWAIIIVISVLLIYFHGPVYSAHTANFSPSILTSIGIFGTFLGVALGLNEFDTQSVENSVPALLDGLKTAFWTSIAGLLGALSIKLRYAVASMRVRSHREAKQTATIDDLAWHLEKIASAVSKEDSDSWIVWREQQSNLADKRHESLIDTLNGYQTKMTDANREALEKAITHVMREFNTRIEDQYGDNFKRLNESVGQMMEWQKNYKAQIEDLMSANERYAQSSKVAADSFEKLISQTSSFTSVAEDMETLLNALQNQSENLSSYLSTFTTLIVDAQEGLPQIETRILALTTGLQDLVKGQTEQMKTLLESTATGIRDTSQEVSQLLLEGTTKTQEKMGVQLEDLLNKNNAQFDRLEESMEAELNKALTTFGYQLTSLSEKFVNDYMPLTDKLRDLVTAVEK